MFNIFQIVLRFRRMQLLHSLNPLFFFIIWAYIFYGNVRGHQVTFYIHNKCPFPIWPATASNTGQPIIADGGFYLASSQTKKIQAPWSWSGRIWARTGCNFDSNSWKPSCETGDCDGKLACNGLIGTPPATLVEITLQGDKGKPNFYDVSLVDGYNVPVSITPSKNINSKCNIQGCLKDVKSLCPNELQVLNSNGEVVACKSACLAFDLDNFCRRNGYGSQQKCRPNVYSRIFKDACPNYFSFAFDTPTPLVSCGALEYVITFCPYEWGGGDGEYKYE